MSQIKCVSILEIKSIESKIAVIRKTQKKKLFLVVEPLRAPRPVDLKCSYFWGAFIRKFFSFDGKKYFSWGEKMFVFAACSLLAANKSRLKIYIYFDLP